MLRVLGHFASYINHYIKIYKNPGKIQFVRNNFQFSLHFLAEKFCSMKSFPYLCSVKRMKMVISSVGMLMLSAQFAASVDFPSTLRRSLALKSNVLRLEGLPDGQSTRNGRAADGDQARNRAPKRGQETSGLKSRKQFKGNKLRVAIQKARAF